MTPTVFLVFSSQSYLNPHFLLGTFCRPGGASERLVVPIHPFRVNGTTNNSRPHTESLLLAAPHAAHGHAQHRRELPRLKANSQSLILNAETKPIQAKQTPPFTTKAQKCPTPGAESRAPNHPRPYPKDCTVDLGGRPIQATR
jgi:hypothetical protein